MTTDQALAHGRALIRRHADAISRDVEAGADPIEALRAAVEREQAYLQELTLGETERAQATRSAIADSVYDTLTNPNRGGS